MTSNTPELMRDGGVNWQSDAQRQALKLWERLFRLPSEATSSNQTPKAATPSEIVYQNGPLRLLRYRADRQRNWAESILICFSLVNRPYILDLPGGRSVIQRLLDQQFDVYLIDWGSPEEHYRSHTLADYTCRDLKQVADVVVELSKAPQINLVGYCMGGTMASMFTAMEPAQVRNLVLMAAPIEFRRDSGLLSLWAQPEIFDVDRFVDAFGNCPGWFLQSCFQLMRPIQNCVQKHLQMGDRLKSNAALEDFMALERWANDSVPVAGETFREFVKLLYQQNQLVEGKLQLDGRPVDLAEINCPVLTLTASRDHLVLQDSSLAIERYVQSADTTEMSVDAGHIGLAIGNKAHRELWPAAVDWIAKRSTPLEGDVN